MAFKDYKYGAWRTEIRKLLQKRLSLKDKIRYHNAKAKIFEEEELPKVEKELDRYLEKAGNKL